jgi:hypothetical protein
MVSKLAIEPKVHRFEPGQRDGFLGAIKMCSMPLFRGELKPIPSHHFTECKNHFKV